MTNSKLGKILQSLFTRQQEYCIKSGTNAVSVCKEVLQGYLNNYWNELFPQQKISNKVHIKKNKIHVSADLPSYPLTDQKILIETIKKELGSLFSEVLGYNQELYLSVTFKSL
jgi:hypothetical protein